MFESVCVMGFSLAALSGQHWLLLVLAAAFCAAGAAATMHLVARSARNVDSGLSGRLFVTALCGGTTVWCTDVAASLALRPAAPFLSAPLVALLALLVVFAGTGLALEIAVRGSSAAAPEFGGAVLGLAIVAAQLFDVGGPVGDAVPLVVSIALGVGLATLSLRGVVRRRSRRGQATAVVLFAAAVFAPHLVALVTAPLAADGAAPDGGLGIAVMVGGLLVLAAGLAGENADERSRAAAAARMRRLADATREGLVVTSDGTVVEVNEAFQALSGLSRERLLGRDFAAQCLPLLAASDRTAVRTAKLRIADGTLIDVEVCVRDDWPAPGQRVYAVHDIRERLLQERRIHELALSDPLTGLPNRARLDDFLRHEIDHAEGGGRRLAVIIIDIIRFREINEAHGHAVGDEVLRTIGRRIAATLHKPEFAARHAGEEFIALKPFRTPSEMSEFTARLEAATMTPIWLGDAALPIEAAIGAAVFPDDGQTRAALLNNADLALQRAKRLGSGSVCYYRPEMDGVMRMRRRLAQDLRAALERDELALHFQPQISLQNLRTGQTPAPRWAVRGYEALLRWHHPEFGPVPPAEFVPIAEEAGLIRPIGEWVLRSACETAAGWPGSWQVAVNLSPAQLSSGDLPSRLATILAETGLSPERLEIEIGETSFAGEARALLPALAAIRDLGVAIVLDDFGGGGPSLAILRAFRFDRIKLSRSLVAEIGTSEQARALLDAVLALGRSLGTPMLAAGVETPNQFSALRAVGCEAMQGYLFGRPAPHDAVVPGTCSMPAELASTGTVGRS